MYVPPLTGCFDDAIYKRLDVLLSTAFLINANEIDGENDNECVNGSDSGNDNVTCSPRILLQGFGRDRA